MAERRGVKIDCSKPKIDLNTRVAQTSDSEKNMLATYVHKRERARKFVLQISFQQKLARDLRSSGDVREYLCMYFPVPEYLFQDRVFQITAPNSPIEVRFEFFFSELRSPSTGTGVSESPDILSACRHRLPCMRLKLRPIRICGFLSNP